MTFCIRRRFLSYNCFIYHCENQRYWCIPDTTSCNVCNIGCDCLLYSFWINSRSLIIQVLRLSNILNDFLTAIQITMTRPDNVKPSLLNPWSIVLTLRKNTPRTSNPHRVNTIFPCEQPTQILHSQTSKKRELFYQKENLVGRL